MAMLGGVFLNQSRRYRGERTDSDCSLIAETVFQKLPSGPLTPSSVPLFRLLAEVPSCHSVYLRQDGYLAHANRTEGTCDPAQCFSLFGILLKAKLNWCCSPGCMFDKVVRHFYDDTCVVPEKVEGECCCLF